ncbi:MAG: hypothetical protein JWN44_1247 [Myxococcales bacterium]|nr:hypothetical protein [Myxococcales bacterium]
MRERRQKKGHPLSAIRSPLSALGLAVVAMVGSARAEGPVDMGASVSVTVEANGDTTVEVKRGDLKVKSGGHEAWVGAGDSIRASKGKPLKKVLVGPVLVAPADQATVGTLDVGFTWQKVPGASRYLLELSTAPEFSSARSQTVDSTRGSLHLDPATWYWRVVAIDADGAPGKRSMPRRLTIDTTPPKLKTGKPEWR